MKTHALFIVALFALMPLVLADTHAETEVEAEASAELDARIAAMQAERNPSGIFYGLQNAIDRLRLNLERDETKRAERALEMSERRLAELNERTEAGDERGAQRAARAHERNIEIAERALERVEGNGEAQERMQGAAQIRVSAQAQLEHVARVHQGILDRQEDWMSEEQIERLQTVFALIEERLERVDERAEERRQNARTQARAQQELSDEQEAELEAEVESRTRLEAVLEQRERALQERLQERNERAQEAIDERAERARQQLNAQLERQLERVEQQLEERRQRVADRAASAAQDAIGTIRPDSETEGDSDMRLEAAAELELAREAYEETTALYERATADGSEYPRAQALIREARQDLGDAREYYAQEAYERTQVLARQARAGLMQAQDALQTRPDDSVRPTPSEKDMHARATAEVRAATHALETGQHRYQEATGTSPELERARTYLSQASDHVADARRALNAEEYSAVMRAAAAAHEDIRQAVELIKAHNADGDARPDTTDRPADTTDQRPGVRTDTTVRTDDAEVDTRTQATAR